MVKVSLLFCILTLGCSTLHPGEGEIVALDQPHISGQNDFYISNREPLKRNPLIKLPIGSITPRGWLLKQIELQADGFHGHLGELSKFLIKEKNAWLDPQGHGDHGWEEVPYWLKGYSNCAYILGRAKMIAEAREWIEGAIRSQKPDGWFGPDKDRGGAATRLKGRDDLWPNMIMLFCLIDYYDFSGDERVIDLMKNYFRYLHEIPEEKYLLGYWPKMRGGDNLYCIYWLYNRTGDPWLLELAEKNHRRTARWDEDVINWHNVNIGQAFGEPGTYWIQSKVDADLSAAYRNWTKVRDLYGQVPGGMFGADENARPGCDDPRQAVETCGMVEEMLSDETLVWITGDLTWADRCEDVAFNSLPAALTADLKALRYLTAPNMPLSDRHSKSPGLQNGGPMLQMNPHRHRCCQHNWGHGWPYYSQHLWFATHDNGLAAVLFSASKVTAKVGHGVELTMEEETHYPFEEQITFALDLPEPVRFPLYLRVPGWCRAPLVKVNDGSMNVSAKPGQYIRIHRMWKTGDHVTLELPLAITIRSWEKNHHSISVDRGPLTYSLKIDENYVQEGGTDEWPAWEIHPTTPWNYGLVVDEENPDASFQVVRRAWPSDDMPFTHKGTPIELRAKGRRIPQWRLDHHGLAAELQDSPVRSEEPEEKITLIPMGAARLRISAFPVIGRGHEAHEWEKLKEPLPFHPTASHCYGGDSVTALCDLLVPKSSGDHGIPRMTWWDHKGTTEWVQYTFEDTNEVTGVDVYWFDDTGAGQCRVPNAWRLFYLHEGTWMPVKASDPYGVSKDRFNEIHFDPITTDALKLEVELQNGFSGGILEWKVHKLQSP